MRRKKVKKKNGLRPDGSFYWSGGGFMLYLPPKKAQNIIKVCNKVKGIVRCKPKRKSRRK